IPWKIGTLPPGFGVRGYIRRQSPGSGQDVEQLTISDGLATVSVFIDSPAPGEQSLLGAGRVQAMPAFGARLDGRQVTALGAAPMATLQQVVKALMPVAPASLATPAVLPATSGEPP
ncbi:MAG TPA: MucB/RseB C-terminal domain-containing protein, partial [Immundisolibacter sp.]|nr:MucB/RseB C-terminal domain-containing protein [Immundisolibacter sp.]